MMVLEYPLQNNMISTDVIVSKNSVGTDFNTLFLNPGGYAVKTIGFIFYIVILIYKIIANKKKWLYNLSQKYSKSMCIC